MEKRASKTAYFLNRALGYLALIGRNVRLPESGGVWILVADAVRAPWEVAELLAATYPGIEAHDLPFTALLTDFDVEEFEAEMKSSGRAAQAATPVPIELPATEETEPAGEEADPAVEQTVPAMQAAEEAPAPVPATAPDPTTE
jgi:hypothetical protein